MIRIDLKLFVTLAKYLPGDGDALALEDGTTVKSLIDGLGIPKKEVKLIFVNGKKESLEYPVKDGDRVGLFPPVGGG